MAFFLAFQKNFSGLKLQARDENTWINSRNIIKSYWNMNNESIIIDTKHIRYILEATIWGLTGLFYTNLI